MPMKRPESSVMPRLLPSTHADEGGNPAMSVIRTAMSRPQQLRLAFMFPGGGAQYAGMGKELYDTEPVYRAQMDVCAALALKCLSIDLRQILFDKSSSGAMERPSSALPALFATEHALATLWMSVGVEPAAMIGHSLGEYVAACLAGVFSLQDAIYLVGLRGVLFEKVDVGSMLSVPLPSDALQGLLGKHLSLAAVNGPNLCVVSGPSSDISRLQADLDAMHIQCQRIRIAVPAHSSLLDSVCDEFSDKLLQVRLQKPEIPFVSNVTGNWISDSEARDPDYWVRHFRNTVQFATGMQAILRHDPGILLEVGPGRALTSLARLNMADDGRLILPSLKRRNESSGDKDTFYSSLSRIVQSGFELSSHLHERVKVDPTCIPDFSDTMAPRACA
jgi:acyl transferase domain-containing protein